MCSASRIVARNEAFLKVLQVMAAFLVPTPPDNQNLSYMYIPPRPPHKFLKAASHRQAFEQHRKDFYVLDSFYERACGVEMSICSPADSFDRVNCAGWEQLLGTCISSRMAFYRQHACTSPASACVCVFIIFGKAP